MTCLISYLAIVFSIQVYMRDKSPRRLTTLFQAHNVILSAGSLLLLLLILEEVASISWGNGFFYSICSEQAWTPRLEFYYMINYYLKYIELFDTAFLALKKKPLQFLHVYHHSATAFLCYVNLNTKCRTSWVVISLNLVVHVIMYYYYYATAGGARLWWKKYLTALQIVQFIIDFFIVYFATYTGYARIYFKGILPTMGTCTGIGPGQVFSCALLTSYLGLFVRFYFQTYKLPSG